MNGYPVYVLNNYSNVSTTNPFPVLLQTGLNSIGSVSILQGGTLVTKENPLPVYLNSNAITITGSVTIPATVTVDSSSNDPVHVHIEKELPMGSNHIGSVSISSPIPLPVSFILPTASNIIGSVNIQTSNNTIIPVSLQTASNYIGSVSISSPIPLPVSFTLPTASNIIGSVNILNNGSNITSNNPLQVQLVANTSINPSSNTLGSVNILTNYSNVSDINPVITQPASMLLDSFGRTRVSECYTLGDYKHIYGIDPNFQDVLNNGGITTFVKNKACCTLTTSSASNSSVIHQTKQYHNYQPGKSQLIYSSICFGAWQSNVVKRTGYYDDNDGIYFEQNGSTGSNGMLTLNIRSYYSGSPVIRSVAQSYWNHDRLDGTGPSGLTMDITKTQLFIIDFKWLGVGSVRCAFGLNGKIIQVHEFLHANVLPTVYMTNPSLPIRCEILNTGTTTGGSMDQICSTVISEGGYVETGIDYSVNGAIVTLPGIQYASAGVLAIRLANRFFGYSNHVFARLNQIQVYSFDQPITYDVIKVESSVNYINGGSWLAVTGNSAIEYNTGPFILSNNLQDAVASGVVAAGGNGENHYGSVGSSIASTARRNLICQNVQCNDSSAYVIYCSNLAVSNSQHTARVLATMQWREVY